MPNPTETTRALSNPPEDAQRPIGDEKLEAATWTENAAIGHYISPLEIQARFPTLRELSGDQMDMLNKKVRRIIDWRMMPAVTLMFLMK